MGVNIPGGNLMGGGGQFSRGGIFREPYNISLRIDDKLLSYWEPIEMPWIKRN